MNKRFVFQQENKSVTKKSSGDLSHAGKLFGLHECLELPGQCCVC